MFLVIFTTLQTIIGLKILNINNYLMLGVLCGILDILPYIGTVVIFTLNIIPILYQKLYNIFRTYMPLFIINNNEANIRN